MFTENTNQLAQHKLLLLYILDKVDIPMNNSDITQFVLENNFMDYFMVQQFLSELVSSKFIEFTAKDGHEYYHLSKAGKDTLSFFVDRLPEHIIEDINNRYRKKKEEMIKESQITSNYYKKSDSEYIVILRVIEKDISLFNLSLNVVSSKQAKEICENWQKRPQHIYQSFMNLLIQDKETDLK